ncbi:hypothetical protein UlMin_022452 [Ulmus minor]
MKVGILEVLLVNAEGIRHTNLIGTPAYFVYIECGAHVYRSKISSGEDHEKAWWNEKFTLEYPFSEWKDLTHIKFRIMDKELFSDDGFVGETIIHLGRIITEGSDSGFIVVKPAPYNVVLEDDTYKGELKIGFKFIVKVKRYNDVIEKTKNIEEENKASQSTCSCISNIWRLLRFWSIFWYKKMDCRNKKKNN